MDQNQGPHSRKKTVGSGSAKVGKGRKVNTGSGPVGSGSRKTDSSSGRASSSSSPLVSILGSLAAGALTSGSGKKKKKISLKTILIIIAVIVIIYFAFKFLSGMSNAPGNGSALAHINDGAFSYTDDSYSSYTEPDTSVSDNARAKRVTPLGNGKDTVTIMVYMCGTDLESKYGMATKDLQEMLKANISDKVNLIVETGGCKKWKNTAVSSSVNQIYKIENGKMKVVKKNAGTAAMTDPKNLTNFIDFCEKNYPANRNMLIFWDHGGGSLTGYGYDEKNPSSSMTLDKVNSALKNSGCVFDFIGFDACLMATLETALVCNSCADYLIASEETEPGTGWYYTNWLTNLSKNTSTSTVDIGKTIVDDFVSSSKASSPSAKVTLSLIDLAEMQGTVPSAFSKFSTSTTKLISSDNYKLVSDARAGVRQFSEQNKLNQVDLVDLAQRINTTESNALAKALHGCVKYNKSTISRCNGVSIYFPYETTSSVKNAVASYKALGIDDEYAKCIKSFASLEYGGQIAASSTQIPDLSSIGGDLLGTLISSYTGSSSSTSPLTVLTGSLLGAGSGSGTSASAAGTGIDVGSLISLLGSFSGRSMPAEYDWVDTELISDHAEDIAKSFIDPSHLKASTIKGKNVLNLEDEEWNLVQTVELNVYVKDGDGYIDMGLDNTFEWYENCLLLDYDGTWLTLNGHACAYYMISDTKEVDGSWTTVGRIPALLNGEFVNLRVVFDKNNPEGVVTGAYPLYEDDSVGVQAKGNIEINEGDKIELLCDYYDLNGNYNDSYTLGASFTVPASGLKLTNLELETGEEISAMYKITDIYGNSFWIPVEDKA